jgi:site-specific recombinase XerD
LSNARLVLSHSHFKAREQDAIGIVRASLEALRRKAQVMQKLVWKQRSHSLDAPEGPLVDHLAQFESLLGKQGYPSETIRRFLLLVADFSRWLKAQPLTVKHVTHATAERYLRYRLHHRRRRKGNAPALRKFVQILQHHGVVELEAHVSQTVVERLISDYSSYLHQERGLAATTVRKYVRAARSFVIHPFNIALWMGHESVQTTQIYLDANLELKEKVLAKVRPHNSKVGRYRPGSKLTAFLASL